MNLYSVVFFPSSLVFFTITSFLPTTRYTELPSTVQPFVVHDTSVLHPSSSQANLWNVSLRILSLSFLILYSNTLLLNVGVMSTILPYLKVIADSLLLVFFALVVAVVVYFKTKSLVTSVPVLSSNLISLIDKEVFACSGLTFLTVTVAITPSLIETEGSVEVMVTFLPSSLRTRLYCSLFIDIFIKLVS